MTSPAVPPPDQVAGGVLAADVSANPRTAVLIHGAWHGDWVWNGVVAELERMGVRTMAVQLPFTGFPDDVAAARRAIERARRDAVVCGHSYGGSVLSAAARGLPLRRLVYLCAFMTDEGDDVTSLMASHRSPSKGHSWARPGRRPNQLRPWTGLASVRSDRNGGGRRPAAISTA